MSEQEQDRELLDYCDRQPLHESFIGGAAGWAAVKRLCREGQLTHRAVSSRTSEYLTPRLQRELTS